MNLMTGHLWMTPLLMIGKEKHRQGL